MKNAITKIYLVPLILLYIPGFGISQQVITLLPANSSVTIKGTSNLHDWEEKVGKFEADLAIDFQDKKIAGIDYVNFACQANSITSDYSIMTTKTLNALRAEEHPEIMFTMIAVEKLSTQKGIFSGILTGDLIVAGVKKRVRIEFSGNNGGDKISVKGSEEINMIDYNIEPPTALLGTLKTGEKVVVSFNLQFQIVEDVYLSHKTKKTNN